MGNYIFNKDVMIESLGKAQRKKQHDFGAHVIPSMVESGKVFAYDFGTNTYLELAPMKKKAIGGM